MIIESIRDFMRTSPHLKGKKIVNVDYLGKQIEYTIDSVPSTSIIERYVDGGKIKQFVFVFASREYYGKEFIINMENQGFYEKMSKWIEQKNDRYELPELTGGKESVRIEVLDSGYLYHADEDTARYQMQLRLVYYEN